MLEFFNKFKTKYAFEEHDGLPNQTQVPLNNIYFKKQKKQTKKQFNKRRKKILYRLIYHNHNVFR